MFLKYSYHKKNVSILTYLPDWLVSIFTSIHGVVFTIVIACLVYFLFSLMVVHLQHPKCRIRSIGCYNIYIYIYIYTYIYK